MDNEHAERLIDRTLAGDARAREELAHVIMTCVQSCRMGQLGPYSRDPDCRAEVCARVVCRFLTGSYERLRAHRARERRNFRALLRVTTARVAIDLAHSMSQNISRRPASAGKQPAGAGEQPTTTRRHMFHWIREVPDSDIDAPQRVDFTTRFELRDVWDYLEGHRDRVAVELLCGRVMTDHSWAELADPYQLSADAARLRVNRLTRELRDWRARRTVHATRSSGRYCRRAQ